MLNKSTPIFKVYAKQNGPRLHLHSTGMANRDILVIHNYNLSHARDSAAAVTQTKSQVDHAKLPV